MTEKYAFARSSFANDFGGDCDAQTGMTLRDYFASHSLTQAIEDYDRQTRGPGGTKINVLPYAAEAIGTREEIIAIQAYKYADAMISARLEKNKKG